MQREYQHKKFNARDRDGVYYYGTTDYYHAGMLYYAYGVSVRHHDVACVVRSSCMRRRRRAMS